MQTNETTAITPALRSALHNIAQYGYVTGVAHAATRKTNALAAAGLAKVDKAPIAEGRLVPTRTGWGVLGHEVTDTASEINAILAIRYPYGH